MQINTLILLKEISSPTSNSALNIHKSVRCLYFAFVAVCTGFILNYFVLYINKHFELSHSWTREYYVAFGQIGWQLVAISIINPPKALKYLSNMSTVSLIGGILLLPVLVVHYYYPIHIFVLLAYFACIVSFMLFEHLRRCKRLGLPL